jgi:hypothetical protein
MRPITRLGHRLPGAAIALPLALSVSAMMAVPAGANITGGCTATASDSTGKAVPASIHIQDTPVWNVSKDSQLSGSGKAPGDQTYGYALVMIFGYGLIPIAGGKGHGTTGQGSLDVSAVSKFVRVIPGWGQSDSCSGSLVIVVQDEKVLDTLAGQLSLLLMLIGAVGLIAVAVRRRRA